MPSQLRLRAMAAGASTPGQTLSQPQARSPVRTLRSRVIIAPSTATLSAMCSIQASIDARHEQSANAAVDTRDGRTKIYVGGYEFTRANITRVKVTCCRCSYYRSQECPAKLAFYTALMDYDFHNMVPHTCTPPSRATLSLDQSTRTLVVRTAMQREVDRLATSSADTPQEIWEAVSASFYNRDDNVVIRGLNKAQVTKRVHRTRAAHFGSDVHGRVEVPPLSLVKLTGLNFFQFHHVWTNPQLKTENKIDRLIGWAHPSLFSLLRYGKISLFIDGTFRCVPTHFRQCLVVMVFDQGSKLYVPVFYILAAPKTHEAYWNAIQYVRDACGEPIDPKQIVCDFEYALILDILNVVDPAKIAKQGVAWVRARMQDRCKDENIKYSTRKWRQFWAYFARTWITLHPPAVWNVHGLNRGIVARTNNPLERFNRELNAAFGTPHPSLIRFVQTIEEISRRYVRLRDDIARGVATPPRRDPQADLPTPVVLPDVHVDDEEEDDDGEDSDGDEGEDGDDVGDNVSTSDNDLYNGSGDERQGVEL